MESPERSLAVKAILSLKNALAEKNELNPSKKVKTEIDESDETYVWGIGYIRNFLELPQLITIQNQKLPELIVERKKV